MALFTDPGVITLDDLLQYESSLVDVCSSYGIDVQAKIKIATDGIGDRLMLCLFGASQPRLQTFVHIPYSLKNVVVTPVLNRWLCFETLSRVYAEAYNVQLNTRYQGKWTEYKQESQEAGKLVYSAGLGLVLQPLAKPSLPIVSIGAGSISSPALFIQTAWVNANGLESAPSAVTGVILNGFAAVTASVSADLSTVPAGAVGWSVFASESQTGLSKQNLFPIPAGTAWQFPATGVISGAPPSGGQIADMHVAVTGRIQRG